MTAGWRGKCRVSRLTQMARRSNRMAMAVGGQGSQDVPRRAGQAARWPLRFTAFPSPGRGYKYPPSLQASNEPKSTELLPLEKFNSQFHKGYTLQTLLPSLFFFWANTSIFPIPHFQIMSQSSSLITLFLYFAKG